MYLVYPTPTFCLQKSVEPVGWCRKSGAGPAAQKPPTMVLVCLVSSVIFFLTGTWPWSWDFERHLWMCRVVHSKHRHTGLSASSGGSTHVQDLPLCVLAALTLDRGKGTCECAALFTANTDISGCLRHQEGQRKYNWAGHTSVPVHTMKSLC